MNISIYSGCAIATPCNSWYNLHLTVFYCAEMMYCYWLLQRMYTIDTRNEYLSFYYRNDLWTFQYDVVNSWLFFALKGMIVTDWHLPGLLAVWSCHIRYIVHEHLPACFSIFLHIVIQGTLLILCHAFCPKHNNYYWITTLKFSAGTS